MTENTHKSPYRTKDPYPVPDGLRPNDRFAQILLDNYAGPHSELTAVTQYIYHHLEAAEGREDISACLRGIAIVEMRHLDLLGGCIRQLGSTPRYRVVRRGRASYWSARCVSYSGDLRQMLESDLRGEHVAIRNYRAAMAAIRESQICNLLQRIIEDEEVHIGALENLLRQL